MDTMTRLSELTAANPRLAVYELMRWLSAKTDMGGVTNTAALELFEQRWPTSPLSTSIRLERKAAVLPGTTSDVTWAGNLVAPTAGPLLALVQQEALIGRVPFARVPFNAKVPTQSSLGSFAWVSEAGVKGVTKIDWASTTLPLTKAAGIIVLSAELVKLAQPGSEDAMRRALVAGLVAFLDKQLLDPTVVAVAGKNPASLTNAVTPITAVGTTIGAKANEVLAALYAARPAAQAVLIATPAVAAALAGASMTVVNNQPHYAGAPVFTSPAAGTLLIAADASAVLTAVGELTIDVSKDALVEMVDNPTTATAATVYVSLFQTDMRGFLVEQAASWAKGTGAVQVVAA